MTALFHFLKSNMVFTLAALGALGSMAFVPPSRAYAGYVDCRTLALLFCLMAVVAGFEKAGVFARLASRLFHVLGTVRQLAGAMIFLCFFASMWITNDVSLITFVPFALDVFHQAGEDRQLGKVVVLQTVAANLGSMCTPVGNPQNLYLFLISGMGVGDFVKLLLPYTVVSFVLLLVSLWWFPSQPVTLLQEKPASQGLNSSRLPLPALLSLFLFCMLTVGNVLDYRLTLGLVLGVMLLRERDILKKVDYILLLTFVAFFVLIGNLKQIPLIYGFLTHYTAGHEVLVSLLASQVISNVPAAILLSGFTRDYAGLMIGTDIGGLGTLIASMASLISYQLYVKRMGQARPYLVTFTWVNGLFLGILVICYLLL